jgi:hypothetical protein
VTSQSSTLHNISIPEQAVDQDIEPGSTVEVSVTMPSAGVVPFFCKFHAALGQRARGRRAPRPARGAGRPDHGHSAQQIAAIGVLLEESGQAFADTG